MARVELEPGTFVRIPLADGSFGFGRVLDFPNLAFYDFKSPSPEPAVETIALRPVLFKLAVHKSAWNSWSVVGWCPLDPATAARPERFKQEIGHPERCAIIDAAGNERSATQSECVGLERVAVWEANHVADRLLDAFRGWPNKWAESLKVHL